MPNIDKTNNTFTETKSNLNRLLKTCYCSTIVQGDNHLVNINYQIEDKINNIQLKVIELNNYMYCLVDKNGTKMQESSSKETGEEKWLRKKCECYD